MELWRYWHSIHSISPRRSVMQVWMLGALSVTGPTLLWSQLAHCLAGPSAAPVCSSSQSVPDGKMVGHLNLCIHRHQVYGSMLQSPSPFWTTYTDLIKVWYITQMASETYTSCIWYDMLQVVNTKISIT
jgi:hypothetical protein